MHVPSDGASELLRSPHARGPPGHLHPARSVCLRGGTGRDPGVPRHSHLASLHCALSRCIGRETASQLPLLSRGDIQPRPRPPRQRASLTSPPRLTSWGSFYPLARGAVSAPRPTKKRNSVLQTRAEPPAVQLSFLAGWWHWGRGVVVAGMETGRRKGKEAVKTGMLVKPASPSQQF